MATLDPRLLLMFAVKVLCWEKSRSALSRDIICETVGSRQLTEIVREDS